MFFSIFKKAVENNGVFVNGIGNYETEHSIIFSHNQRIRIIVGLIINANLVVVNCTNFQC